VPDLQGRIEEMFEKDERDRIYQMQADWGATTPKQHLKEGGIQNTVGNPSKEGFHFPGHTERESYSNAFTSTGCIFTGFLCGALSQGQPNQRAT
jgi:hypothetical protein